jgi:hypothetical protein
MKKQFIQSAKVIILSLILVVGVNYAIGWGKPSSTPTSIETQPPINEGPLYQYKQGGLAIIGNLSAGGLYPLLKVMQTTPNNIITIGNSTAPTTKISLFGDQLNHTDSVTPRGICITSSGQLILCVDPINGQCGSANGGTSSTLPSASARCALGTPSPTISNYNTWDWTCNGSNGGTVSPPCSANK